MRYMGRVLQVQGTDRKKAVRQHFTSVFKNRREATVAVSEWKRRTILEKCRGNKILDHEGP